MNARLVHQLWATLIAQITLQMEVVALLIKNMILQHVLIVSTVSGVDMSMVAGTKVNVRIEL